MEKYEWAAKWKSSFLDVFLNAKNSANFSNFTKKLAFTETANF